MTIDFDKEYKEIVEDFGLEGLSQEDREAAIWEIAKTTQKQFLLDVHQALGEDQFRALEASANMGEQFYITTLKHLLPNHEEMFRASRDKVRDAFKKGT